VAVAPKEEIVGLDEYRLITLPFTIIPVNRAMNGFSSIDVAGI
jgi:hypothetical protein